MNSNELSASNGMDTQQINFDMDPEAVAADDLPPRDDSSNSSVVGQSCCCFFRILLWYIAPITYQLCHSLKCIVYHLFNFCFAIFLFTFDWSAVGTSVGLFAVCCIGLPMLWITMECVIVLAKVDLGAAKLLIQQNGKLDESRAHLLKLTLYATNFPLCCCWNRGTNFCKIMKDRMKYLFFSSHIYVYLLFQMIIKPFVALFTMYGMVILTGAFAYILMPVWYLINDSQFHDHPDYVTVLGYGDHPHGCSECPDVFWKLKSMSDCIQVMTVGILALPLVLRHNNFLAWLNKLVVYRFYSLYYSHDESKTADQASLLQSSSHSYSQKQSIDSV